MNSENATGQRLRRVIMGFPPSSSRTGTVSTDDLGHEEGADWSYCVARCTCCEWITVDAELWHDDLSLKHFFAFLYCSLYWSGKPYRCVVIIAVRSNLSASSFEVTPRVE
jgi:hypothetical protein